MLARLASAALRGLDAESVDVEIHLSRGLPCWSMVGLPDAAVRESRDRVRSALLNSHFEFPLRHITVNLSPADRRKDGPYFDLPVAIGLLLASGQVQAEGGAYHCRYRGGGCCAVRPRRRGVAVSWRGGSRMMKNSAMW